MESNDPAPALGRGLRLLRLLDGGAWRLEDLVRATALPRSSLARILDSLAANGCVRRDGFRWQATARLAAAGATGVERWRPAAEALAMHGWRGEVWSFQPTGPVLVSAVEPSAMPVGLVPPGWTADPEEWMAPVQLWWAVRGGRPSRAWYRDGVVVRRVARDRIRTDLAALRNGTAATCPTANHRGLLRTAMPLPERDGCLAAAATTSVPAAAIAAALMRMRR